MHAPLRASAYARLSDVLPILTALGAVGFADTISQSLSDTGLGYMRLGLEPTQNPAMREMSVQTVQSRSAWWVVTGRRSGGLPYYEWGWRGLIVGGRRHLFICSRAPPHTYQISGYAITADAAGACSYASPPYLQSKNQSSNRNKSQDSSERMKYFTRTRLDVISD